MTPITIISISCAAAGATMAAGLMILLNRKVGEQQLHLLLGATAGLLLACAFVDLIPAAFELSSDHSPIGWTIALGFLALYAIEWAVGIHGHGGHGTEEGHEDVHAHRHGMRLPLIAFFALSLHRIVDGLAMPTAFAVSPGTGFTAGAAILAHQFPDGLVAVSLFLASGWGRRRVIGSLFIIAALTPLGAIIGLLLLGIPSWQPHLLALTAATFIFISAAELLPELHNGPYKKTVAAGFVFGYGIAYMIELLAGH